MWLALALHAIGQENLRTDYRVLEKYVISRGEGENLVDPCNIYVSMWITLITFGQHVWIIFNFVDDLS